PGQLIESNAAGGWLQRPSSTVSGLLDVEPLTGVFSSMNFSRSVSVPSGLRNMTGGRAPSSSASLRVSPRGRTASAGAAEALAGDTAPAQAEPRLSDEGVLAKASARLSGRPP